MLRFFIVIFFSLCLTACNVTTPTSSEWELSTSGLYDADISPDGHFAVISSFTHGVSYWDIEKRQSIFQWNHGQNTKYPISKVRFSADGKFVMTADLRTFVVWDLQTGKDIGFWEVDSDILAIALSNDGKYALLGLKDGHAIHIDLQTHRRLEVVAHQGVRVTTVDISASGKYAITGGADRRAVIWNAQTGKEHKIFNMDSRIKLVKFDQKHPQVLIATERNKAIVFNSKTGKEKVLLKFKPRQGLISSAQFSNDGKQLLLGFPARDVSLWSIKTGELVQHWRLPNRRVGISPQSSTTYSAKFNQKEKSIVAQASSGLGASWKVMTQ